MNFYQNLADIRNDFENGDTPQEIVDVLNSHVEELLASDTQSRTISVGESAPMDSKVQFKKRTVSLSELIGEHYLVLTWFRGNW